MKKILSFFLPLSFMLFVLFVKDKALTQDLGRHIALGKIILSSHAVPPNNLFSFTMPNQSFINHHWLSEVVFFILFSLGGINLIVLVKMLILLAAFGLIIWLALRRASPFWVVVFSVPYILMFSERFDARPEIFSFLFLSIFLIAIEYYRKSKNTTLLWLLPIVQIFWTNMHIYFLVGIGLLGLLIIEQLILYRGNIDKRLFIITFIVWVVTLINPHFIIGALYPFLVLHNYGYSIEENQNIFFLNTFFFNSHILIFEILATLLGFGVLFHHRKKDLFLIFSSIFGVFASIWMIRNFPLFVLITFPYITYLFTQIGKRFSAHFSHAQDTIVRVMIIGIVSIIVLVTVIQESSSPFFGFGYIDPGKAGIDFYLKNSVSGPIFNNFDIGSYLIYRLYPKERVFVDGRPEAYTPAFFSMYKKMQENPGEFEKMADRFHLNSIIFGETSITPWGQTFLSWITQDRNWKLIYADGYLAIFVRNVAKNNYLIHKYGKGI